MGNRGGAKVLPGVQNNLGLEEKEEIFAFSMKPMINTLSK